MASRVRGRRWLPWLCDVDGPNKTDFHVFSCLHVNVEQFQMYVESCMKETHFCQKHDVYV